PSWCYAVNALTWLVMLAALFGITKRIEQVERGGVSLLAVREGFSFLLSQPVILAFMVLDFGATFFGSSNALYPIYARDILNVGPVGLGVMYAAPSIGAVIAGLVMSGLSNIRRTGRWVVLGVASYGACIAAFAL